MIQTLRKRFICINMLLVCAVLLAAFGASAVSACARYRSDCTMLLLRTLEAPAEPLRFEPGKKPERGAGFLLPSLYVEVNAAGEVAAYRADNLQIAPEAVDALARAALAAGRSSGFLREYGLEYLVRGGDTQLVAFADASGRRAALLRQLWIYALLFLASAGACYGVSVFLSRRSLKPVEQAWAQQRQFVSDASHELKTPLTVILANTAILLRGADGAQHKWLQSTQDECVRMKELIDELLFLAKSDEGRVEYEMGRVDLSDAVTGGMLPFEAVAFEAGITLECDVEPGLFVAGDAQALTQLVGILLDNACKYAGRGGRVRAALHRQKDGVCFRVNNTGPVLSEEAQQHIFDRFYRADEARAAGGGSGLGLSIARSIADRHGAVLCVASDVQRGTTFELLFPSGASGKLRPGA